MRKGSRLEIIGSLVKKNKVGFCGEINVSLCEPMKSINVFIIPI